MRPGGSSDIADPWVRKTSALTRCTARGPATSTVATAPRPRRTQRGFDQIAIANARRASIHFQRCMVNILDDGEVERAELALANARRLADGNVPLVAAISGQYAAEIALLRNDACTAARLKGYSDARMAELDVARGATEQRSYRRLEAGLRAQFDATSIERFAAEGRALDQAQVIATLSPSTHRPSSDRIASHSR